MSALPAVTRERPAIPAAARALYERKLQELETELEELRHTASRQHGYSESDRARLNAVTTEIAGIRDALDHGSWTPAEPAKPVPAPAVTPAPQRPFRPRSRGLSSRPAPSWEQVAVVPSVPVAIEVDKQDAAPVVQVPRTSVAEMVDPPAVEQAPAEPVPPRLQSRRREWFWLAAELVWLAGFAFWLILAVR